MFIHWVSLRKFDTKVHVENRMTEIPALFELEVEGDVGTDPNFMTLWFSQPSLGLPSKVNYIQAPINIHSSDHFDRSTMASRQSPQCTRTS